MIRFECDYGEGAHPRILELLQETNYEQTPGYGEDRWCPDVAFCPGSSPQEPDLEGQPGPGSLALWVLVGSGQWEALL